ncbi:MAG: hypothetical protein IT487_05855 [Chromatiaceae bacterium]|nr:hypothetical protein [Chromatiaceae bacterium]
MCHALATFARRRLLPTALLLTLAGPTVASAAADFHYQSRQDTAVAITLATDGNPLLLSFYSEGPHGLRLLENGFTAADGTYTGALRLPAHLAQVVMVIRGADRQDTLTLAVQDQTLGYTE